MARAETAVAPPHRLGIFSTLRGDTWWVEPALTGIGMLIFFYPVGQSMRMMGLLLGGTGS